ncbi:MAG: hypothetical protein ABI539_03780, partial [Acidobacteriota bacterium]
APYYYDGCFRRESAVDMARGIAERKVMLLAGIDAPEFQDSTLRVSKSFPASTMVQAKTDLSPSGYSIMNASIELNESYDQRVIDFFRNSLSH